MLLQDHGQEVRDGVRDGREAEEDEGVAINQRVGAGRDPLLEVPGLLGGVVAVRVDALHDLLALGLAEAFTPKMGAVGEVEDREVADGCDDDGAGRVSVCCVVLEEGYVQETFHDEDPAPAAEATDTFLLYVSVAQSLDG